MSGVYLSDDDKILLEKGLELLEQQSDYLGVDDLIMLIRQAKTIHLR